MTNPWFRKVLFIVVLALSCRARPPESDPSGSLEAVETVISPTLGGRVLQVRVAEGDTVRAGDLLLVMDAELLRRQRAQTAAGKGTLAVQLRIARETAAAAQATLNLLDTTLARTRPLVAQGDAPVTQLDELKARRDVAAHQWRAAELQRDALSAELARLDAALAVLDRQLEESVIHAPSDGVVTLRAVEPGEVVQPGAVCLKVADLSRMEFRIYLAASELALAPVGKVIPVEIDAFPGREFSGTVAFVSPEAEFTPKNVQTRQARTQLVYAVKLTLPNPDRSLRIGMTGQARLSAERGR